MTFCTDSHSEDESWLCWSSVSISTAMKLTFLVLNETLGLLKVKYWHIVVPFSYCSLYSVFTSPKPCLCLSSIMLTTPAFCKLLNIRKIALLYFSNLLSPFDLLIVSIHPVTFLPSLVHFNREYYVFRNWGRQKKIERVEMLFPHSQANESIWLWIQIQISAHLLHKYTHPHTVFPMCNETFVL